LSLAFLCLIDEMIEKRIKENCTTGLCMLPVICQTDFKVTTSQSIPSYFRFVSLNLPYGSCTYFWGEILVIGLSDFVIWAYHIFCVDIGILRLTYQLTPWSRVVEKLIVAQLVELPAIYGTRRFITLFTRARHWSVSWDKSIQSTPYHSISLRSILIFSSHLLLGLPNGFFPYKLWSYVILRHKLKVKSLCLTKHHAMRMYWEWRFNSTHSWPRH
jgi:hypothetical protein